MTLGWLLGFKWCLSDASAESQAEAELGMVVSVERFRKFCEFFQVEGVSFCYESLSHIVNHAHDGYKLFRMVN